MTPTAVLAGIAGPAPAEPAVRAAFREADRRGAPVRVVAAGRAAGDDFLGDLVARWADKYPEVPSTLDVRRRIDAAVTLVAATRGCAVAFVAAGGDAASSAVLREVLRRAHCPVHVTADAAPTALGG